MSFWTRLFGSPAGEPERKSGEDGPTETQREMLRMLSEACAAAGASTFDYRIEWQGYLPNPLGHWVEVGGRDVSHDFPRGWTEDDLDALLRAGAIREAGRHVNPEDGFDKTVTYELVVGSGAPGTPAG
jgi:hypothetical protein